MEVFQGKENPFTVIQNADETISVFLGNPGEIGAEAEHITTISPFWLSSLIEKLKEIKV